MPTSVLMMPMMKVANEGTGREARERAAAEVSCLPVQG